LAVSAGIDEAKQAIRTRVWDLLVAERVVERGVHGYIPAFAGAEAAADRLAGLPEWRAAQVVKAVPDRAQQPVRERALRDGKLLYVAVPKLAADPPFFVLDPADLTAAPAEAASREYAARRAGKIGVEDMRRVDLVVCGSVDLIVTPDEVIECEPQRRPSGLYWNNLPAAKIAAIPVLAARAAARRG
jgi:5-formyltetrahydrofolate cyclo-ligase